MELSYQMNPETAKHGANGHYDHRYKVRRFYRPIVGLILIAFAIFSLVTGDHTVLMPAMFFLGTYLLFIKQISIWRSVRASFHGKPQGFQVCLKTSEESLIIETNEGNSGETKWQSFLDFKALKNGLLLYPQKNLYFWIPSNAEFTTGSWPEFTQLIESKVTCKL